MRWYLTKRAKAYPELDTWPVARRYEHLKGEADPHAVAGAAMTLRDLAEAGIQGQWDAAGAGEVMMLLDRLEIPYHMPRQERMSPDKAFDELMAMPQEGEGQPSQVAPAPQQGQSTVIAPGPAKAMPVMPPARRRAPRRSYTPR